MSHARLGLRGSEAAAVVFVNLMKEVILQTYAGLFGEQLFGVTVCDALAAIQDGDVVAEVLRVGQDVAGEEDRATVLFEVEEDSLQIAPAVGVEAVERLVEDHQL